MVPRLDRSSDRQAGIDRKWWLSHRPVHQEDGCGLSDEEVAGRQPQWWLVRYKPVVDEMERITLKITSVIASICDCVAIVSFRGVVDGITRNTSYTKQELRSNRSRTTPPQVSFSSYLGALTHRHRHSILGDVCGVRAFWYEGPQMEICVLFTDGQNFPPRC